MTSLKHAAAAVLLVLVVSSSVVDSFVVIASTTTTTTTTQLQAGNDDYDVWKAPSSKRSSKPAAASSWMDKNTDFLSIAKDSGAVAPKRVDDNGKHIPSDRLKQFREERKRRKEQGTDTEVDNNKTFRQDFRGTRVFVQNIPEQVSWQSLKDHFRIAGTVVFASISVDSATGTSKGCGIVQFETTDMAKTAMKIMRDHPLDGAQLYVREDAQDQDDSRVLKNVAPGGPTRGPTPPSKWKCADEDIFETMTPEDYKSIRGSIQARDNARYKKDYTVSDNMRESLKRDFGVHLDDRLKLWWVSMDGKQVPNSIIDANGSDGRWGKRQQEWRHIPTPMDDGNLDIPLVQSLLKRRDDARYEKDFETADALLEQARTSCPDGTTTLRIHDESRTWRIWTDEAPVFRKKRDDYYDDDDDYKPSVADECVSLVERHAPEKVEEVRQMLDQFPGREGNILQKLKQRYL